MTLASIATPRVCVDRTRLLNNIGAMQARAHAAGVRLRPHAKTHKSPEIARWQIEAGAIGICCAKLGEAEVFAEAAVADIRIPYPVNPSNSGRVAALLDRVRLSIIVDDLEVARGWSHAMVRAGRTLDVLVKVDVGFHRCGVDPDSPTVVDVIRRVADLKNLRFAGLLSHAGHSYLATSDAEIDGIAAREIAILSGLAARLRGGGTAVDEISVGSTPTARCIGHQPGATEMRPGNYVFFDRTQAGLEAAAVHDCSQFVVSTVVSRPAADRVIFDAGAKTLTTDGVRGFKGESGYGLVYASLDATAPDHSILIERLSEEHATAKVPAACPLRPGDRVKIIANHACVVTNLTDELLLIEGLAVVDRIPVAARGKTT